MADFTALKSAIQTYIKQNGNEEITGEKLQEILLSMVTTLGDSAINDLITALNDEVAARQNADGTLQQNITNEATARANGDSALANRLGSSITAENTAADQIGAEAEARAAADTALQGLIDGITENITNGYVYAGIATPSSTPATGKVFYLALTAGTYTNFGSIEVSQGINILKYNGSAWSLDAFIGIDDKLTPGSNNLPKSGNVLENVIKNGSAFDLSAYNAVDGVLATYADLSAALTALNALPAVYKQGGMSMKFVLTSDNKYVRYNLIADEFTTDVTKWAIADEGVYVENPEFVYVKTDAEGKILWAIRVDGSIYWGAGVPQQVIDYVEGKIADLSLDEYDDIVTFLGNLINEHTPLATLLNGKVDKEAGKGIVVTQYVQDIESNIDNSEWMRVETDSEDKILGGRRTDGTVVEYFNVEYPNGIPSGIKNYVDKKIEDIDFTETIETIESDILNLKGKKLVTIGDSLTANCIWQPRLAHYSGMIWSSEETADGVGYVNLNDGTYTTEDKSGDANYRKAYKMAIGGTSIRPTSINSIYIRSLDAKYYNPNIIILYGGENDPLSVWKSSGNQGTTPEEIVANETPYLTGSVDTNVSTIAAYKGMIEKLLNNCPQAVIYIVSSMRVYGEVGKNPSGAVEHSYPHPRFATTQDVIDWENNERFPKVQYIREIAKLYNLPLIDLWSLSGINDYNASSWYPATAEDCTQVHPNQNGYYRMADIMLKLV